MELLSLFSNSLKATDPRDRVYGILGLTGDKNVLGIDPDYKKEVHEVYSEVAKVLFTHNYTDVLSWCQFSERLPGLPSWVPNFSVPLQEPYGSYKNQGASLEATVLKANLDKGVKISTQSSLCRPKNIAMYGFTVNIIKKPGRKNGTQPAANWFWPGVQTYLTEIKQFLEEAQMLPKPLAQDQNFWDEAIWRIPCADQESHHYIRRRAEVTTKDGHCEVVGRMHGNYSGLHDKGKAAAFSKYDGAMEFLYGVRPFLSQKRYVGLAPEYALPGDKVCIILGAIVPYVFTKSWRGGIPAHW